MSTYSLGFNTSFLAPPFQFARPFPGPRHQRDRRIGAERDGGASLALAIGARRTVVESRARLLDRAAIHLHVDRGHQVSGRRADRVTDFDR